MSKSQRKFDGKTYHADVRGYPFWDKMQATDRAREIRGMGLGYLARITKAPTGYIGKYMVWIHNPWRK
jgi:hypothetical protein